MTTAEKPEGPWAPLHLVKAANGWEDPCPLWDEEGNAWLGRSQLGAGPIYIHRMSADGRELLDEGVKVYEGPVAEGTKLFIRDGYIYLSIPEGGVPTGWQMVLRSKNIYGPYEGKRVLEQGATNVNGPHQGALVDTPDGEWWFYHFQSQDPQGRILHLQPVTWQADGFPLIGKDLDGNGIGEPMKIVPMPSTGKKNKPSVPQTSDDFDSGRLGIQWQTNHNPTPDALLFRKGMLGIKALRAENVKLARNQQTQKTMGYRSSAMVKLQVKDMKAGQRAGMASLGSNMCAAGIMMSEDNQPQFYFEQNGTFTTADDAFPIATGLTPNSSIWIRLDIDALMNTHQFSLSLNGKDFHTIGENFSEKSTGWKGNRISLFTYTSHEEGGTAWFDDFTYDTDGKGEVKK